MLQAVEAYWKANELFQKLDDEKYAAKVITSQAKAVYASSWIETNPAKKRDLLNKWWNLNSNALDSFEKIGDQLAIAATCNDMMEGSAVPVGSDQVHALHFRVHLELAMGILSTYQQKGPQSMDVRQTLVYLQQAIPHMQQHLQYMSMDPTRADMVKEGMQALNMLAQFAEALNKAQEQLMEQQQQEQAAQQDMLMQAQQVLQDRESMLKMQEIQKDYEVEMAKQNSLNQMRAQKTAVQMDIRRAQTAENLALSRERQAAEIELKQRELEAKIALEQRQRSQPE